MFIFDKNAVFIFPHYTGFTMTHEALGDYFDKLATEENQNKIQSVFAFDKDWISLLNAGKGRPYPAHPSARYLHRHLKVPFESIKWFATVRNPWSRYWGVYHYFLKNRKMVDKYELHDRSFDEFIFNHEKIINENKFFIIKDYLQPLHIHLAFLYSSSQITFKPEIFSHFIKFETFNYDMEKVSDILNVSVKKIDIRHKKNTYIDEMSTEAKDCIYRICQREIRAFKYEFEEC